MHRTLKHTGIGLAIGLGVYAAIAVGMATYNILPEPVRAPLVWALIGAVAGLGLSIAFRPEKVPNTTPQTDYEARSSQESIF